MLMRACWLGFMQSAGETNNGCGYWQIVLLFDIPIPDCDGASRMQPSEQIGRRIKLHDLRVLSAVVQAGSMSKAARLLNTTQSTISKSIAELEQTIGARLLDRNAQGVEPTHYG